MTIWFEWNPAKAAANVRKYGVSFEVAQRVFADPFAVSDQDRIEGGEARWRTIGLVEGRLILLVAHTYLDHPDGDETIRIISARAATRAERRRYEQARQE